MFKYLSEDSADVIAIKFTGKADKGDYESLIPELEKRIDLYGKVNLYWEMEDFEGWQPSAFLQDVRFDVKHANDFNRIAIVGEKKWEEWLANVMKPFSSAEIKYFDLTERQQALTWVQEKMASKAV